MHRLPGDVAGLEARLAEAIAALESCSTAECYEARSRVIRTVNDWTDDCRRAGKPLPACMLDSLMQKLNNMPGSLGARRASVVRVGHRLHLSSGLRFH